IYVLLMLTSLEPRPNIASRTSSTGTVASPAISPESMMITRQPASPGNMSRREALLVFSLAGTAAMIPANRAIRLGGPIFLKSQDPHELAREHRRLGYSAAYCPEAEVQQTELVRGIREAYAAQNVVIAEVGAWNNMLDADVDKRKKNLQYVASRLA